MSEFTKGSIEFLTVAIEMCRYVEVSLEEDDKRTAVKKMGQILSLLYLKATMVEVGVPVYDEEPECFVDENDYNAVMADVSRLLGADDQYLTALHPDMAFSDTAVVATVSEDIADIYQPVKNFVSVARLGDEDLMNDALIVCMRQFDEFWGTRLLSAMLSLHQIYLKMQEEEVQDAVV